MKWKFWQPPEYKYVSWYQEPRRLYPKEYVMLNSENDWQYTNDFSKAYRFPSQFEASVHTPVYDGSNNIKQRSGVIRVKQ